jgi:hypothetical protein
LTEQQAQEIRRGKDFVQLKNGPFDPDLIFAPDGIDKFDDASKQRVDVEGFPVCGIDYPAAGLPGLAEQTGVVSAQTTNYDRLRHHAISPCATPGILGCSC